MYPGLMQPRQQQPQAATEHVQVTAQAPSPMDDLREQLVKAIADQLGSPQPQAPQYQPGRATPVQAFAQARNPQLSGLIESDIQAPGQARFQQQQAAFEQAMRGRREAMASGVSMLNAGARQSRYMRPQLRMVQTTDEYGNAVTKPMLFDPETETLSPMQATSGETQFDRFVADAVVPGVVDGKEGIYKIPRQPWRPAQAPASGAQPQPGTPGGTPQPRSRSLGGGITDTGVMPRPTNETVEKVSDIQNVLRNIDTIKRNPLIAPGDTGEFAKRAGQEVVRAFPLVGPQVSSRINPDAEGFNADIDNVRSRVQLILTGKVVNPSEMKRLLALIPAGSTATNPEFFNQRLQRFQDEFIATLRRQARLRPDLFTPDELMALGGTTAHGSGSSGVQEYIRQRQQALGQR